MKVFDGVKQPATYLRRYNVQFVLNKRLAAPHILSGRFVKDKFLAYAGNPTTIPRSFSS